MATLPGVNFGTAMDTSVPLFTHLLNGGAVPTSKGYFKDEMN